MMWNSGVMRHDYFYTADTAPLGDENLLLQGKSWGQKKPCLEIAIQMGKS